MTEVSHHCPSCGSSAVEFSPLVGGGAKCLVCTWKGDREDLLSAPFDHMYGGQEGINYLLVKEVKGLFGSPAMVNTIARFLARWGFIDIHQEKSVIVGDTEKYLKALAQSFIKTIVDTRLHIEKERAHAGAEQG